MRVLVVEDQRDLADDIVDGLHDAGIAADVAYDGALGIEKALMNRYGKPCPWDRYTDMAFCSVSSRFRKSVSKFSRGLSTRRCIA